MRMPTLSVGREKSKHESTIYLLAEFDSCGNHSLLLSGRSWNRCTSSETSGYCLHYHSSTEEASRDDHRDSQASETETQDTHFLHHVVNVKFAVGIYQKQTYKLQSWFRNYYFVKRLISVGWCAVH